MSFNFSRPKVAQLTCTFRASCYSARLSWAIVLTWVSPFRAGLGCDENRFSFYDIRAEGALPPSITVKSRKTEREREMFYLTTHSTHFIYGYMASDIWLRTILIVRKETRCRHMGYSFRLTARVLLYAPSHRQDSTYHGLCYTSRGALAGTRYSSMGPPHEGSIRRPIHRTMSEPSTSELHPAPRNIENG